MRYNPFTHHRLLTNAVIALFVIAFLLSAQAGELKPLADIAWLDILGEGGIVLMPFQSLLIYSVGNTQFTTLEKIFVTRNFILQQRICIMIL